MNTRVLATFCLSHRLTYIHYRMGERYLKRIEVFPRNACRETTRPFPKNQHKIYVRLQMNGFFYGYYDFSPGVGQYINDLF